MKKDYIILLNDIKQTLSLFAQGKINFDEALQRYTAYKEKFNTIKTEPQYQNVILNILATHNAKNFSIFSAIVIFTTTEQKALIALYHGPHYFLQPLSNLLTLDLFYNQSRHILDYIVTQKAIKNFTLYSSLLFSSPQISLLFIAISSSSFFSQDAFIKYASQLHTFISPYDLLHISSIDIPNITLKNIHQTCLKLLKEGTCNLYGLHTISPINTINHLGLHALFEFSKTFKHTLNNTFRYSFAISTNKYVCIDNNEQHNQKTITFTFRDIPIPIKIMHQVIAKEQDIIPAIIKILQFH